MFQNQTSFTIIYFFFVPWLRDDNNIFITLKAHKYQTYLCLYIFNRGRLDKVYSVFTEVWYINNNKKSAFMIIPFFQGLIIFS